MAELLTDRGALDEYMGVWFRSEVPDTVEIRSTTVIFCKQLEERIESRRLIIDHLEKVRGCPTYGWLKRLKENNAEDLEQLGILNVLVERMYATVRMLTPMRGGIIATLNGISGSLFTSLGHLLGVVSPLRHQKGACPWSMKTISTLQFMNYW
ncbi:hypothetical protein Tco_0089992 [Tanacetum coccineum]